MDGDQALPGGTGMQFHIDEDDCEDFTSGKTEDQARVMKQLVKQETKLRSTVKSKID